MNQPARDSRLNRLHLSVTIVTSLLAAGLGVYGLVNRNEAQNLTVDIQGLSDDLSSLEAERDSYSARIEELEAELDGAGDDTGAEEATVSSDVLSLDDNVGLKVCSNTNGHGEWHDDPVQFAGEERLHAFSCVPYVSTSAIAQETSVGYIDFLVADGAQRMTGAVGFDGNSADTAMTAEFVIQSVPESAEPLFRQDMSFGDLADFEVDVSDHTRVRFQVTVLDTELTDQAVGTTANASWADVQFE